MEKQRAEWLTVKDVGEIFSLSRSTVYELMAERKIQRVKVGAKTLISRRSIDEWLDMLCHEQSANAPYQKVLLTD